MKIIKRRIMGYDEALDLMNKNGTNEFFYGHRTRVYRKDDGTLHVYFGDREVDYRTFIAFYEALALIE